jgi:hypothetical protein
MATKLAEANARENTLTAIAEQYVGTRCHTEPLCRPCPWHSGEAAAIHHRGEPRNICQRRRT